MEEVFDENGNPIVPMERYLYPALSGRSKRKLNRKNTIHWIGVCPECGGECRFHKFVVYGEGKKNKWICRDCKKIFDKEDFKDGTYL